MTSQMYQLLWCMTIYWAAVASGWSSFLCPAPRSPVNGEHFIFENGQLVKFRCLPGYRMVGEAEMKCIRGQWSSPTPKCLVVNPHGYQEFRSSTSYFYPFKQKANGSKKSLPYSNFRHSRKYQIPLTKRPLFSWGEPSYQTSQPHGAEFSSRRSRLPIINNYQPFYSTRSNLLKVAPPLKESKNHGRYSSELKRLVQQEIDIAAVREKSKNSLVQTRKKDRKTQTFSNHNTQGRNLQAGSSSLLPQAASSPRVSYSNNFNPTNYHHRRYHNSEWLRRTNKPAAAYRQSRTYSRPKTRKRYRNSRRRWNTGRRINTTDFSRRNYSRWSSTSPPVNQRHTVGSVLYTRRSPISTLDNQSSRRHNNRENALTEIRLQKLVEAMERQMQKNTRSSYNRRSSPRIETVFPKDPINQELLNTGEASRLSSNQSIDSSQGFLPDISRTYPKTTKHVSRSGENLQNIRHNMEVNQKHRLNNQPPPMTNRA